MIAFKLQWSGAHKSVYQHVLHAPNLRGPAEDPCPTSSSMFIGRHSKRGSALATPSPTPSERFRQQRSDLDDRLTPPPLQESVQTGLASLPTDVLLALCRAVQLDAVTSPHSREMLEMIRMMPGLLPKRPQPAFTALRLCCRSLRAANDSVRTSIRFNLGDMGEVEPYLRKLPNLTAVELEEVGEQDAGLDDVLRTLHGAVPRLERLVIKHDSAQPSRRAFGGGSFGPSWDDLIYGRGQKERAAPTLADLHTNSLLPWCKTLRHLELHNVTCHEGEHTTKERKPKALSKDLSFLASFPALQSLHLDRVAPRLTSRNLRSCAGLRKLCLKVPWMEALDQQKRMSLDLSPCPLLQELSCKECGLEELDVSVCPLLVSLDASCNNLRGTDLSCNPLLKQLSLDRTKIKQLDTSCCPLIESIGLEGTPVRVLKMAGCSALTSLSVNKTCMTELDLSSFPHLDSLDCDASPIAKLNLTGCTRIKRLHLSSMGGITSLDLTGMSGVTEVGCSLPTLTSLTLTGCTALDRLELKDAQGLVSLELSSCSALKVAEIKSCGLVSLDVTGCFKLEKLACNGCSLKTLDEESVPTGLASLPADVLQALCRAVQLDAVTSQQMRDAMEIMRRLPKGMLPGFPKPSFTALRLCCKSLRSANDSVRTSIRFNLEDMEEVEPYLRKLPNLTAVAVEECEEQDAGLNDVLCALHSITPRLECLTISLLPWGKSLRHLELHNVTCHQEDYSEEFESDAPHEDLSFLSSFPALHSLHLDCVVPTLASPDLGSCTGLRKLCLKVPRVDSSNPAKRLALDLSQCPLLQHLSCKECGMPELDVSGCPRLVTLEAACNNLQALDLSRNPLLQDLSLNINKIRQLDTTRCPLIQGICLEDNPPLRVLRMAGCTALTSLSVNRTLITELDLAGFPLLERLHVDQSPISKLNLTGCTKIEALDLSNMGAVATVDLTGCSRITELNCALPSLTALTLAGCTALDHLSLRDARGLTSLDVSSCRVLKEVTIQGCGLVSLNVAGCSKLKSLACLGCKLKSLDLSACMALSELDCRGNSLTRLNVSECPKLARLDCTVNPLKALCTTGCRKSLKVKCPEACVRT
ncbi:MAG: hypothetical protein WDW38_004216 [Sanguina aurantia]